jgi:hypothetical protein
MLGDMEKRYQVILAYEQREELERLIARGAATARRLIPLVDAAHRQTEERA